jgi:hypothetical protein
VIFYLLGQLSIRTMNSVILFSNIDDILQLNKTSSGNDNRSANHSNTRQHKQKPSQFSFPFSFR